MKPRIFIGSSVEGLQIAYAIQENLEFDAQVTIWDQGVFELASNTIDSLVKVVNNSDFGIFVFKPDDITNIKNDFKHTVRDNVLFELGLFIGRLGKDKVFFVVPRNVEGFHLPSDLLGITSGIYDSSRPDGNIRAALGPFCNQVRAQIRNFTFNNLNNLQSESNEAKKIAHEKPRCWEYLLSAELLEFNLIEINRSYTELEKGLIFVRTKRLSDQEFLTWYTECIQDLSRMTNVIKSQLDVYNKSFGELGIEGNILEIKTAVIYLVSLSKELLAWEYRLLEVEVVDKLQEIINLMKGWSRTLFDNINIIPSELRRIVSEYIHGRIEKGSTEIYIRLDFKSPDNIERTADMLTQYFTGLPSH